MVIDQVGVTGTLDAYERPRADRSQGVQPATIQELARCWENEYDWRRCEAKLNALPFTTEIDGLNIHFIHVKSRNETRCR